MEVFDYGLKSNWREFKNFVERYDEKRLSTTYYFVIDEDDCGDEVNIFTSHSELDDWLEKMFFEWERYDTSDLEESMNDVNLWMLIPESDVKRLSTLYKGSKPTSIVKGGEKYFRKLIPVSVEQTVIVSTNWY